MRYTLFGEHPDDDEQSDETGDAVLTELTNEIHQVRRDTREEWNIFSKDDLHHHANRDEEKCDVHELFDPALDNFDGIHARISLSELMPADCLA